MVNHPFEKFPGRRKEKARRLSAALAGDLV
jgi:hypothetical protein